MAYEYPGDGSLDYHPCRYGMSRLTFRGPKRDLARPYVAVLGGTETYGKFVAQPYPALVEARTGLRMVNLGIANAGLDAFLKDPDVMDVARKAECTVVQITGAQNLSNRFYSVHPRRNDRFLAASPLLRSLFNDVDFTEYHFTRHLLRNLQARSPERFELVAQELRATWLHQMRALMSALPGKVVLIWVGQRPPASPEAALRLDRDPLLVDAEMLQAVRPLVSDYVEVAPSIAAQSRGLDGMVIGQMEAPIAMAMPGPRVHSEIAEALTSTLAGLI